MSICYNCDLSRMDVGNQKKCTKSKKGVSSCPNFIDHKCRSCANMSKCSYVKSLNKNTKNYKFIKKIIPTSKGFLIAECSNYKFIPDKPRGNTKKLVMQLHQDFDDGLTLIDNIKAPKII